MYTRPAEVPARAILRRRHHGESDLINSLVTPCTLTAPQRQHSRCRAAKSKNADDPDHLRARKAVEFSVSERPSPHKIINFHHTSLIASDLGHIAHLFRRFHGGGSNGFSLTIDAGIYSENPCSNRQGASPRFATHIPLSPRCGLLGVQLADAKCGALTVQIVRMY